MDNGSAVPPLNLIASNESLDNFQKGKLLVLDIDQTLCDYKFAEVADGGKFAIKSPAAPRPYLHKFLEEVQEYYDIALWSATPLHAIIGKMNSLGITNKNFNISFVIDNRSMLPAPLATGKVRLVKPLSVIWKQFHQYNATNTIIVDDKISNFELNPKNGLLIAPYFQSSQAVDNHLIGVSRYLIKLAQNCNDFSSVNHADYKNYNPNG